MLRSMTGYGSSEVSSSGRRVRVEIRSVNQRFLDIQVRAPRMLFRIEDRIRRGVESVLNRGRVSVYIEWKDETAARAVAVDRSAARELTETLRGLKDELSLSGDVDVSVIASFPQLFEQPGDDPNADEVWGRVEPALAGALRDLVSMREAEGAKLEEEIRGRLGTIASGVETIEGGAAGAVAAAKERLGERIASLLDEVPVEESRLAQEIVLFAERSDFTEEIVRLRAHIDHARESIDSEAPAGKRLNFLVQEMHREANTIGSKNVDAELSSHVVALKEEIEKLREQVQNVE